MNERVCVDEDEIDRACCEHLAEILRAELRLLEDMGVGHIPFAEWVRRYLTQYDASAADAEDGGRPAALRLVRPA
jgi:hypothetical protein